MGLSLIACNFLAAAWIASLELEIPMEAASPLDGAVDVGAKTLLAFYQPK